MKIIEQNTVYDAYKKLVNELKNSPIVGNTKEINNAVVIVHNPNLEDIRFCRKLSQKYSDAELNWYWTGDNSCKTIGQFAKMWLSLSDDGKTNNSAYGYILFKKYGFDQLKQIIEVLEKDRNSRRAVLNISDPAIDRVNTHDMQCTIAIQFLIRNNKLEETVYMRSNDVYFGFPYDYIFFTTLGKYIADHFGIEFSLYTHNATSLHMYLRDEDKFTEDSDLIKIDTKKIFSEHEEIFGKV